MTIKSFLTIILLIIMALVASYGNRVVDLSELFTKKMYMAAHDQRDRRFDTPEKLKKRGIDIINGIEKGEPIILKIVYYYTFNRRVESVRIQEYKWNNVHGWEII